MFSGKVNIELNSEGKEREDRSRLIGLGDINSTRLFVSDTALLSRDVHSHQIQPPSLPLYTKFYFYGLCVATDFDLTHDYYLLHFPAVQGPVIDGYDLLYSHHHVRVLCLVPPA